ncbi:MAG: hypothetical protein GEU90_20485 [Gemmatimonas sp.]|nr:hypothetical protein [Gemmatimonas sp.]
MERPTETRAMMNAAGIGTILQLVMVIAGNFSPAVASLFAVLGMLISMIAGGMYAAWAGAARSRAAGGGAIAGGVCGLIGIAASVAMGDVETSLLLFGTASSAVTGAIGGLLTSAVLGRRKALA